MNNHTIKCLNPQCVGGRIETTMEGESGYSEWTILDNGSVEFKCHGCGKFASADTYKKPNEPQNFELTCKNCGSHKWEHHVQDINQETQVTHIWCNGCGAISTEL